jgi:spermidine synthase
MTVLESNVAAAHPSLAHVVAQFGFAATLFLSAGLLFSIEPMFSKMVLPLLGGTSAVWSVAMVVFQGLLLAGYVYAHLLTRYCETRSAALIHVSLLAIATLCLPVAIAGAFQAAPPQHFVSLWLIGLFVASVGLPCFALAANAPLLQAWLARSGHANAANPYFLYRASNLGSFAVLIAYPFLIEPHLGLEAQSHWWSLLYAALLAGAGACGFAASRWKQSASVTQLPTAVRRDVSSRALWIVLGFVPSGLLVAVTAHIATDVASTPFLWILPLALYLLTFVLVFSERPAISERVMLKLQPVSVAVLAVLLLWGPKSNWGMALTGHLFVFFTAAMVCHARLYRLRPVAADLTEFYAYLSLGGVLGGIFAALLAPVLFTSVLEYPLLVLAALVAREDVWRVPLATWKKDLRFVAVPVAVVIALPLALPSSSASFAVGIMALAAYLAFLGGAPARMTALAAAVLAAASFFSPSQTIVHAARSFYGVYKVVDVEDGKFRVLYHGTTAHGAEQIRDTAGRALTGQPKPLAYYAFDGAYGQAVKAIRARNGGRLGDVALIGLGVGALTCHGVPGEHWTIYELDPLVLRIASDPTLFRSLSTCAPSAPVILGDGRLTLRDARSPVDLLLLDIFSSDSVPTHMLTKEAFALYKSKLSAHGAIAFNVSNHNLELASVVAASAAANGMVTVVKTDPQPPADTLRLRAEIAVVVRSETDLKALKLDSGWQVVQPAQGARVWSDDYSDVLGAILRRMRA